MKEYTDTGEWENSAITLKEMEWNEESLAGAEQTYVSTGYNHVLSQGTRPILIP